MKRFLAAGVVAAAILAPMSAMASHGTGCGYTTTQDSKTPVGNAVVYYDTSGSNGGTSRTADQAVGVCVSGAPVNGSAEAGHGANKGSSRSGLRGLLTNGGYVIVDGDNLNPDPIDGYIGVSNYETGSTNCTNNVNCSGTNGGGEFGPGGGPYAPYAPLACGNTTGPSWDGSRRDGCEVP